ncbi:MAG TPA: AI-2E family transporter [Acidimicrobiales bacterium]|nr:AI-2E family transporter [Acidimicrobiales bacterium]
MKIDLRSLLFGVWALVGILVLAAVVVLAMAAVSELVLPLIFAVMLAVAFHPVVTRLRHRLPPAAASAIIVFGLTMAALGVVAIVVAAVVNHLDQLGHHTDIAMNTVGRWLDDAGASSTAPATAASKAESMSGFLQGGLLSTVVAGIDSTIGFVAGCALSLFLMYYVLKDGEAIRDWGIAQTPARFRNECADFVASTTRSTAGFLAARCVISLVVALFVAAGALALGVPMVPTLFVVTFIGGFVPYIGAFVGGGLAALLALSDGGAVPALVMIAIVLVANLVLENLVQPRIMSGRLDIHPMAVIVVTTAGGVIGGLVGLVLAVPLTAIGVDLVKRIRKVLGEANESDPATSGGSSSRRHL